MEILNSLLTQVAFSNQLNTSTVHVLLFSALLKVEQKLGKISFAFHPSQTQTPLNSVNFSLASALI